MRGRETREGAGSPGPVSFRPWASSPCGRQGPRLSGPPWKRRERSGFRAAAWGGWGGGWGRGGRGSPAARSLAPTLLNGFPRLAVYLSFVWPLFPSYRPARQPRLFFPPGQRVPGGGPRPGAPRASLGPQDPGRGTGLARGPEPPDGSPAAAVRVASQVRFAVRTGGLGLPDKPLLSAPRGPAGHVTCWGAGRRGSPNPTAPPPRSLGASLCAGA